MKFSSSSTIWPKLASILNQEFIHTKAVITESRLNREKAQEEAYGKEFAHHKQISAGTDSLAEAAKLKNH
jgi:hypothetical protein